MQDADKGPDDKLVTILAIGPDADVTKAKAALDAVFARESFDIVHIHNPMTPVLPLLAETVPLEGPAQPRRLFEKIREIARPGPLEDDFSVLVLRFVESLSHANARVRFGGVGERLLVSPRFHRAHHGVAAFGPRSCNYGAVLPWWDMLFRTANFSREYVATGDPSGRARINRPATSSVASRSSVRRCACPPCHPPTRRSAASSRSSRRSAPPTRTW